MSADPRPEVWLLAESTDDVERGLWSRLRDLAPRAHELLRAWRSHPRTVAVVRDPDVLAFRVRVRTPADAEAAAAAIAKHAPGATVRAVGLPGVIEAVARAARGRFSLTVAGTQDA